MKYSPDRYKFKPAFSISSIDVRHGGLTQKPYTFILTKTF